MNNTQVTEIPVGVIDAEARMRPAYDDAVRDLAANIAERGLRVPVEVAKSGERYRLVSGAHRLAAVASLGWETIPAFVVKGNRLELKRDELLENLTRNELSMLDRALFLAELKRVHQELFPETGRGGDRGNQHVGGRQSADIALWHETVIDRAHTSRRTVEAAAGIGERLSYYIVDQLRASPIADNQKELEVLSKYGPEVQVQIVDRLTSSDPQWRKPTVTSAVAAIEGRTDEAETDNTDAQLKKLMDAWDRASPAARRRFREHIDGPAMKAKGA